MWRTWPSYAACSDWSGFDASAKSGLVRPRAARCCSAFAARCCPDARFSQGFMDEARSYKSPGIEDWNNSADGRIQTMAGQTRVLMDEFFRRLYMALGALLVLLVCYRVVSILLVRRFAGIQGLPSGAL